jgi:hypothetical protein
MLRFVPLDSPIGKGDILQMTGQSFFILAATVETISGVFLVFLGTEMMLGVSGFASFPFHIDKVNLGQPPGLILISSTDGFLFILAALFLLLVRPATKSCTFFIVWCSAKSERKTAFVTSLHLRLIFKYYFVTQPLRYC